MNIYAFFDISPENLTRAKDKSTALTVAPVAMGAFYFVILFQGLTVINWLKNNNKNKFGISYLPHWRSS